jgi:hypothetical protein
MPLRLDFFHLAGCQAFVAYPKNSGNPTRCREFLSPVPVMPYSWNAKAPAGPPHGVRSEKRSPSSGNT